MVDGTSRGSQLVAVHFPRHEYDSGSHLRPKKPNNQDFKKAFIETLEKKGAGLLTAHLFHEPKSEKDNTDEFSDNTYASLRRRFGKILYGGYAWDEHVSTGTSYAFPDGDMAAIKHALDNGLTEKLPAKIKFIEYGPGGYTGVSKPEQIINTILEKKATQISSYVAVDILHRYSLESSSYIHDRFNLQSYAVIGDFTAAEKMFIPNGKDSTPVVTIFGGSIANAPDYSKSNGLSSVETATSYFCTMNRQHGPGSLVILSFDAEHDRQKLLKQYAPTKAFEAFVLSAFTRAAEAGIIEDKNYDVFANWKMKPSYDRKTRAVSLDAVCQQPHTIHTLEKSFSFKRGERLPIILSHKWDETQYEKMLATAGYEIVDNQVFRSQKAPRGIILARSISLPKCD